MPCSEKRARLLVRRAERDFLVPRTFGSVENFGAAKAHRRSGVGGVVSAEWCRRSGVGGVVSAEWCRPIALGDMRQPRAGARCHLLSMELLGGQPKRSALLCPHWDACHAPPARQGPVAPESSAIRRQYLKGRACRRSSLLSAWISRRLVAGHWRPGAPRRWSRHLFGVGWVGQW
jgi:hypothetical protein